MGVTPRVRADDGAMDGRVIGLPHIDRSIGYSPRMNRHKSEKKRQYVYVSGGPRNQSGRHP